MVIVVDLINCIGFAGAYAMFGPGQFPNLYLEVTKPVERASWVSHASAFALLSARADGLFSLSWVVGTFMGAYRTMCEIVSLFPVWE